MLTTIPALPQIGGGSIVGVVTDAGGGVLVGTRVEATNVATNETRTSTTNDQGYYEFPLLSAGRYVLRAEQPGFQKANTTEIVLNSGTRPRIDIRMTVGQVTESIEVVSAAPLVNATTTELGTVIDSAKVRDLPLNGRNFLQLVGLQPGVINRTAEPISLGSTVGGRGGVEFNGSPAFGNNYLMDGVDMTFGENNGVGDAAAGTGGAGAAINTVSVEGVQEFKATSSAFSAEYGRSTGGVVNITTKSGTNQIHGTAFHFFRNDALNANSFFSNRAGLPRPALRHNQYGGNLGGPILKDKIFYFFNFEGAKISRASAITGNRLTDSAIASIQNPDLRKHYQSLTPAGCSPTANPLVCFHQRNDARKNDEMTTLSRVDFKLRQQAIAVRFNYNDQVYSTPNFDPAHRRGFPQTFKNLGIQHNMPLSATKFNEFRFGINKSQLDRLQDGLRDGIGSARGPGITAVDGQCRINFNTTTYSFTDNLSIVSGRHTFKTGVDIRKIASLRIIEENPILSYNSIQELIDDKPISVDVLFGLPNKGFDTVTTGVYFQDDFRVNKRVTLNVGIRYEYYTPFRGPLNVVSDPFGPFAPGAPGPDNTPVFDKDRNNLAPRLGLVADLLGDGKTILRAGAGRLFIPPQPFFYYDMSFLPGGLPLVTSFRQNDLPSNVSLKFPFPFSFGPAVVAAASSGDLSRLPAGLKLGRSIAQRNRKDEEAYQWNLSLQRALTSTLAVQASYVGSRALYQYTSRDVNLVNPATNQRINPDFSGVLLREGGASSIYHAFQFSVNQRLSKGLTADLYYTWSHAMGYHNPDGAFVADGATQDFGNIRASYGDKGSDTRHRMVLVPSYQVPTAGFAKQSALGRAILGAWTLQGIVNMRTGYPLNVTVGRDAIGNGRAAGLRPDAVPGVNPRVNGPDRLLVYNRAAFDVTGVIAQRRFGNLGFNTLRTPGAFWSDIALLKVFPITERHRMQFRFELFNWLNHAALGAPITNLADVNFGRITAGSEGRSLQLALKYTF
ncbi:MAG: TonB-dependent receptor domain-containing protein [Bryobacteraceae bacterium]